MRNTDRKEEIFKLTQKFMKNPPVIILGSGATIPFGLPSMLDLNETLRKKINGFNAKDNNLEIELEENKYEKEMPQIKKIIWEKVNDADVSVLERIINNTNEFNGMKLLIEKFTETHPQALNIVTTNYDRVLEHVMSYHNISYTDGFNGKTLSIFNEQKFKSKNIVNLVKVHGSLNWFDINDETRFLHSISDSKIPKIISPGKNKYKESYHNPYRDLIKKADDLIENASNFLVVGFGFNDEHLTPKIKEKIRKGTPVVLITKEISDSSYKELENAEQYIFFKESDTGKTKITYKENSTKVKIEIDLEGDLWQLNKFMEIL